MHQTNSQPHKERHHLDIREISVAHYGVLLQANDFNELKKRIEESSLEYTDKPYRRFIGLNLNKNLFVKASKDNVVEMKTMKNPEVLFENIN